MFKKFDLAYEETRIYADYPVTIGKDYGDIKRIYLDCKEMSLNEFHLFTRNLAIVLKVKRYGMYDIYNYYNGELKMNVHVKNRFLTITYYPEKELYELLNRSADETARAR